MNPLYQSTNCTNLRIVRVPIKQKNNMVCIFISLDDPFLIQDCRILCFLRIQNDLTNQILQFKENVVLSHYASKFEKLIAYLYF